MKKITVIFITFAIALSSCATRRSMSQRVDNLPPVYVSLKNILADNVELDRNLRHLIIIDGIPFPLQENLDKKIDINSILSAHIAASVTTNENVIFGNPAGELLVIATTNICQEARRRITGLESSLSKAYISLKSILADTDLLVDNDLCENCRLDIFINAVSVDDLTTRIDINAITVVILGRDPHLHWLALGIERRYLLIIATR